ncbi:DEAD/DEAH box helicase [Kineosporia sp. R_H_3]|uniref:DEAD/DEAH box helicase n=1 Tax=Kineosporia sp. R_H_3 TaxID=1961848 RepID=UPI000B4AEDC1|nr:DEAD/DEAH box helicase [Kineosporia sp. R_H_3]
MADPGRRRTGARRPAQRTQRPARQGGDVGSVLAQTVRDVEAAVRKGRVTPSVRTTFQAVTLMLRDERTRVQADTTVTDRKRDEQLKRLDGIAAILVRIAVRDAGLLALLSDDANVSDGARSLKRDLQRAAGIETAAEEEAPPPRQVAATTERQVVPQSVTSRQLANPFLAPDVSTPRPEQVRPRRLASWELIGPLLSSFERAGGAPACMTLPGPTARFTPLGQELMPHQGRLVAAAAAGHRTFLLADEPGLGKTAQALLAAEAADAYPLLVVVPNVVKTNWAREAARWLPHRAATVVHGDGDTVDGFADIVIVNYDVLDRHLGWLGDLGFRGMVVDEAHFIKNKTSQRSRNVLTLSQRVRNRTARPLLMALTGTPLINDIDDFRAIWQFLGWIDDTRPIGDLMAALENSGLTPADPGFHSTARQCVIDMGIVRRRKVDVAADIPARRIADLHVELDGAAGRSIRAAERDLAERMVRQYRTALEARPTSSSADGVDLDLAHRIARAELKQAKSAKTGDNVFTMMRRIGLAKAALAADYAAQLARSAGKVVFFAKHIDVMDAAEDTFARQEVRYSSIRGDQTPTVRQRNIDAFVNDPDVAVAVCSLTAAGVGLNLQVASNVVLAELSWTDAEQTQAIDRSHRIGQTEPVTAWRIIAAQTLDARISELIGSKAGLAARALDGSDEEETAGVDVQVEALVALLVDALG